LRRASAFGSDHTLRRVPPTTNDAEGFVAELDRHEMVDREVSPARVREAVLAKHGRPEVQPFGVVALPDASSVFTGTDDGAIASDDLEFPPSSHTCSG